MTRKCFNSKKMQCPITVKKQSSISFQCNMVNIWHVSHTLVYLWYKGDRSMMCKTLKSSLSKKQYVFIIKRNYNSPCHVLVCINLCLYKETRRGNKVTEQEISSSNGQKPQYLLMLIPSAKWLRKHMDETYFTRA